MAIGTCNGTAGVFPGWPTGRTHPAVPFRTGITRPAQPTDAISPAASTAGAAATGAAEAADAAAPCMA